MIELTTCPVSFQQEEHKYYLNADGTELSGITSTLIRRLFPDMYAGVPEEVLAEAARRGSTVHEDIELFETLGTDPATPEGRNYADIKRERGLECLASEYLVSDLQHYASSIDLVFAGPDENSVTLCDVKTTARFNREAVAWQLSIYAYFFELLNPAVKVSTLMGLWLRGEDIASAITLPRRTADEVQALIAADVAGQPYTWQPAVPAYLDADSTELQALASRIAALTTRYDALRAQVLSNMQEHGDTSIELPDCTLSAVAAAERATFNAKAFRAEHADLYEQYVTKQHTRPVLRVLLKKKTS